MTKFVQPDPATGYRFTSYRVEGDGYWPFVETGFIYHKIDLSDLGEPYLSAVKESLAQGQHTIRDRDRPAMKNGPHC
jgi:hypothetical protein